MRWIIILVIMTFVSLSKENKTYTPEDRKRVDEIFGEFLNKSSTELSTLASKTNFTLTPTPTDKPKNDGSCTTLNDKEGICVHFTKCIDATKNKYPNGTDIVILRASSDCPKYSDFCCEPDKIKPTSKTNKTSPGNQPQTGCGFSNPGALAFRETDDQEKAQYGEYPWVVALIRPQEDGSTWDFADFIGGATLIHPSVVLTAAHKVYDQAPDDIICRAGEWDILVQEQYPHQDRQVKKIVFHDEFYKRLSINNIALLFTKTPFSVTLANPQIAIACLGNITPKAGTMCQTMGWGRHKYEEKSLGVNYLKKLVLPIVDRTVCENSYKLVPALGPEYELDKGFVCAGGVEGIDTCIGDGGSPLVCSIGDPKNHQFAVIGIVAWGIGCGEGGRPGVYMNVPGYRDWITEHVTKEGLDIAASYNYTI